MTPLIEALLKLKKLTKRDLKEAQDELGKEAKAISMRLDSLREIVPQGNGHKVRTRARKPVQNPKATAKKRAKRVRRTKAALQQEWQSLIEQLPMDRRDEVRDTTHSMPLSAALRVARQAVATYLP